MSFINDDYGSLDRDELLGEIRRLILRDNVLNTQLRNVEEKLEILEKLHTDLEEDYEALQGKLVKAQADLKGEAQLDRALELLEAAKSSVDYDDDDDWFDYPPVFRQVARGMMFLGNTDVFDHVCEDHLYQMIAALASPDLDRRSHFLAYLGEAIDAVKKARYGSILP